MTVELPVPMGHSLRRLVAAGIIAVALAGCEAGGPPGTAGSVNAYVHGRVETGFTVKP